MTDWYGKLTPRERRQWEQFVHHARTETLRMMDKSAMVMSLVPRGEPDVKFCVELGMAIMLDKPIVAIVRDGIEPPRRLRRVADELIIVNDMDTMAGQKFVAGELAKFKARLDLN